MRGTYDNAWNNRRIRTDARTGDSKAMGIRNAHRGMNGEIIGGTLPNGQKIQGPAWRQPMAPPTAPTAPAAQAPRPVQQPAVRSATPRLDAGVQTPRIDAMRNPSTAGESFAQTDARKRRESAASGAFGTKSQNLAQRQALHAEMVKAGSGGISPDMQARGKALGVTGAAWKRTVGGITAAPAMLAATGGQSPAIPSPMIKPPAPDQKRQNAWRPLASGKSY